ncbi:MAG: MliC family protein [Gammaproteobacteria bacterium]|nr:MliC family protein [Gammaproteobacteria bacterium]
MRTSAILSVSLAAALLAAAPVQASADWQPVAYSCEGGEALTVAFRASGSAVQVSIPNRKTVKLNSRPAKSGFRYGDSRHELRGEGEVVTLSIDSRTPLRCTSEDPAAARLAAQATR